MFCVHHFDSDALIMCVYISYLPIERKKKGAYKIGAIENVYLLCKTNINFVNKEKQRSIQTRTCKYDILSYDYNF